MTTDGVHHHEDVANGHVEDDKSPSNGDNSQNGVSDSGQKLEHTPQDINQEAPGVHEHVRLKLPVLPDSKSCLELVLTRT